MLQDLSILEAFRQDAIVWRIGNRLDDTAFYTQHSVTHPASSQGEWESKGRLKAQSFETSEALRLCLLRSLMAQTGITFF